MIKSGYRFRHISAFNCGFFGDSSISLGSIYLRDLLLVCVIQRSQYFGHGISFFPIVHGYGRSEQRLGTWDQ